MTLQARIFGIGKRRGDAADEDRLVRNSVFLMATAGAMAGLGFAFSVVVARVFTPGDVGAGTSLLAALMLIAFLGPLGLDGAMVRFIVHSKEFHLQLSQSLLVAGAVGLLLSAAYVFFVPWYAPELSFVRDNVVFAVGFLLAGAAASANQLVDAVFLGARRPEYNLMRNGVILGIAKVVLPFAMAGIGAYGVFGAAGAATVLTFAVSIWYLRRALGYRFEFQRRNAIPKELRSYSMSSYVYNALNMAPTMVLPLIVLHTLGAVAAAYFFFAFQIANTVNGISMSIGQSLFAEGSLDEARMVSLIKRAAVLQAILLGVAVVALVAVAPLILSAFGRQYAVGAQGVLRILTIAAIPFALATSASYILRVLQRMKSLIAASLIGAVVTIGLAQLWGHRGLEWIGWAWFVGQLAGGLCSAAAVVAYRWRVRHTDPVAGPVVVGVA